VHEFAIHYFGVSVELVESVRYSETVIALGSFLPLRYLYRTARELFWNLSVNAVAYFFHSRDEALHSSSL